MHLGIVLWPHPILLEPAEAVPGVDDEVRGIVAEMRRLMFERRGVGLAGPQVGIARRIVLVCPSGQPGEEEVVFNPEVLEASGEALDEEGCLSFPGLFGSVPRATQIRVRYRDLMWQDREIALEGFDARVILHEIDHLAGTVFIDRMTLSSLARIEPGLDELRRRYAVRSA